MHTTSSSDASTLLLTELLPFLSQADWVPQKETLFRQGSRLVFKVDLKNFPWKPEDVADILKKDISLRSMITQYFIRLHIETFRSIALTFSGKCLDQIKPPQVSATDNTLQFTICPGVVGMMSGEHFEWCVEEPEPMPRVKPEEAPSEHPVARMQKHVRDIPELTPHDMNLELEKRGYCGQEQARRAVCLFAYRHVRRIQALFLEGVPLSQLPPKENLLLQGPTGCGKTYLLELLFRDVLNLPVAIVDVSSMTEAGYAGQDTDIIPRQLIQSAGGNLDLASIGVVCLDEFDKLAGENHMQENSKGIGVQRELLKMIEGAELPPSWKEKRPNAPTISTRCVPFVSVGAFSGMTQLKNTLNRRQNAMGFGADQREDSELSMIDTDLLQRYGFIPELVGRFGRFTSVEPMNRELLTEILDQQVIHQYRAECEREGIGLHISPAVRHAIVDKSLKSGTGARSLATSLNTHMEDACYQAYSSNSSSVNIHFRLERGSIKCRVRSE